MRGLLVLALLGGALAVAPGASANPYCDDVVVPGTGAGPVCTVRCALSGNLQCLLHD